MNAHAGTNAAPSGAIQGRDSTTPGPHASARDAHSDINDLCAAYMRGPNRDFGPTPYERIYCNLGKLEPLLSAFRSNASLPSSLEDLKGVFDGSQTSFISAPRCSSSRRWRLSTQALCPSRIPSDVSHFRPLIVQRLTPSGGRTRLFRNSARILNFITQPLSISAAR